MKQIWIAKVNYGCVLAFTAVGHYVVYNQDGFLLERGIYTPEETNNAIQSGKFRLYRISDKPFSGLFNPDGLALIARARKWVNRVLHTCWLVPTRRDIETVWELHERPVWESIVNAYARDMGWEG